MATQRIGYEARDDFDRDLNPEPLAGENHGVDADNMAAQPRLLSEIKEAHGQLPGFSAGELRRIPVLRPGTRLEQGGTYMDLARDVQSSPPPPTWRRPKIHGSCANRRSNTRSGIASRASRPSNAPAPTQRADH